MIGKVDIGPHALEIGRTHFTDHCVVFGVIAKTIARNDEAAAVEFVHLAVWGEVGGEHLFHDAHVRCQPDLRDRIE